MNVQNQRKSPTQVELTVTATTTDLAPIKTRVLKKLAPQVKVAGFREGKAPASVIEKSVDRQTLLDEFMNEALNELYTAALAKEELRPVSAPDVELKKFVPFSTLEFKATVSVIGKLTLADYTKLKVDKPISIVNAKEVDEVLANLQIRLAEKNDVERAAKDDDQVWIDFKGTDSKKQPVPGADGTDYPLVLGSNTFMPGFEPELVGLKAGDAKYFEIMFPEDYGSVSLQGKKVTFDVTLNKVQEVQKPKLDDDFAAKAGPFTSLRDLKDDIKKQLNQERAQQAQQNYENQLIVTLAETSLIELPDGMIDEQVLKMEEDEKRNLVHKGTTWQEHLDSEGISEEQHRKRQRPDAQQRVKAGLVLSEVAEKEKVMIIPEELEIRIQVLKGQYTDSQMQEEIGKPENRREITAQLLTEKTIARLVELNK